VVGNGNEGLFEWEENQLKECISQLDNVSLHDNVVDAWEWKNLRGNMYSGKEAYKGIVGLVEMATNLLLVQLYGTN